MCCNNLQELQLKPDTCCHVEDKQDVSSTTQRPSPDKAIVKDKEDKFSKDDVDADLLISKSCDSEIDGSGDSDLEIE